MAKNDNKISIGAFESVLKSAYGGHNGGTKQFEWNGLTVEVKRVLDVKDAFALVKDVVDASFLENGTYVPEVADLALRVGVLERYANFSMPDNLERQYALAYATDAYDSVLPYVDSEQFAAIRYAIERKTDMLCDANVYAVQNDVNRLVESMEGLVQNMEAAFSGVSREDVAKIASAVGSGAVDEEKLMKAYLAETKPKPRGKKK